MYLMIFTLIPPFNYFWIHLSCPPGTSQIHILLIETDRQTDTLIRLPYIYGHGVMHWSIVSLSGATHLKKTDFPSQSNHQ